MAASWLAAFEALAKRAGITANVLWTPTSSLHGMALLVTILAPLALMSSWMRGTSGGVKVTS